MHAAHGRTSACDFALAYGVYTCVHVRGARAYLSCVADDHIVVVQVLGSISASYRLYIGIADGMESHGYGCAGTQNDRLGRAVILSTGTPMPVRWCARPWRACVLELRGGRPHRCGASSEVRQRHRRRQVRVVPKIHRRVRSQTQLNSNPTQLNSVQLQLK